MAGARSLGDVFHAAGRRLPVRLKIDCGYHRVGVEPEAALRGAAAKFQARFTRMEQLARGDGASLKALSLDAQNALWDRVKAEAAIAAPPASDVSVR